MPLQGGGSCPGAGDCEERCRDEPHLCSSASYKDTMEGEVVVFQKENPAFGRFTKVYVPYCSSDQQSGDRQASAETANFHFNGRNIVKALVGELHAKGIIGQSGSKVVLAGASTGGAGAAKNCDFVADKIRGLLPSGQPRPGAHLADLRLQPGAAAHLLERPAGLHLSAGPWQ